AIGQGTLGQGTLGQDVAPTETHDSVKNGPRDQNALSETGRALWYVAPGQSEIRDEPLGPLPAGAVRVRARHGAISRGTEALVAHGRVPASEFQRMRAPFMAGAFPFPVKYGYAI